jgi:hypothetical protein
MSGNFLPRVAELFTLALLVVGSKHAQTTTMQTFTGETNAADLV